MTESIEIRGASQNNLCSIDLDIPLHQLTVITGVSGSGKSSLAFDTLYAEGQRRYVESMSAYARQFLERIEKPAVKEIRGISPAIAIKQKNTTRNPRSTVGTVTEIYDFMRLLYARVGGVRCRECGRPVRKDTVDEITPLLIAEAESQKAYVSFPLADSALDLTREAPEKFGRRELIENLLKQGFHRLLKRPVGSSDILNLPSEAPADLEELLQCNVLVDRLVISAENTDRITDSVEMAFAEGNGVVEITILEGKDLHQRRFSERFECQHCDLSYRSPVPRLFSFNNPYGACPTCQGFGNVMNIDPDLVIPDPAKTLLEGPVDPFTKPKYRRFQKKLLKWAEEQSVPLETPYEELSPEHREQLWKGRGAYPGVEGFFDYLSGKKYKMHVRIFISRYRGYSRCHDCDGERLRKEARDVYLGDRRITQLTRLSVKELQEFFEQLDLDRERRKVAEKLLREVTTRLEFLIQVGLSYLTLDRLTSTLSGGETQRIHLAASLGSSLAGTLYVLDEPSIGLHPRDQDRLIKILKRLRDLGNTIVVVEHEEDIIRSADQIVDLGPGAGELGGRILHSGDCSSLLASSDSITGKYLRRELNIATPVFRRKRTDRRIELRGIRQHNLQGIDVDIPLGIFTCVTGVSGSGKSTLVHDVLYAQLQKRLSDWTGPLGQVDAIEGADALTEVMMVDQSPIGKTPRSNPVTYVKAFDEIRKLFAGLRAAQSRNLSPGDFSFNISGGRCESCKGAGTQKIEMQFLADVEVRCQDCQGTRYQKKVLEVQYKGKNIHDVLNMTVREASQFFTSHKRLRRKLRTLQDVGLDYIRLGQSATTLSGGEAQRMKLASYLSKRTSGSPLFIFDEPTTGLHFDDIGKLLRAFDKLLSRGASILVIEHNLDVVKAADWIIDLGPEGGARGGKIVAEGQPEEIIRNEDSHTGRYLRRHLERDSGQRDQESA